MGIVIALSHECSSLKELIFACSSEACSLFKIHISKHECEHYRQLPQHRCKRCGEVMRKLEISIS